MNPGNFHWPTAPIRIITVIMMPATIRPSDMGAAIIFQHEKPLIGIKSISAPIPFNVHTFFGKYILK